MAVCVKILRVHTSMRVNRGSLAPADVHQRLPCGRPTLPCSCCLHSCTLCIRQSPAIPLTPPHTHGQGLRDRDLLPHVTMRALPSTPHNGTPEPNYVFNPETKTPQPSLRTKTQRTIPPVGERHVQVGRPRAHRLARRLCLGLLCCELVGLEPLQQAVLVGAARAAFGDVFGGWVGGWVAA